jgi:cysteine desulfurase
VPCIVGSGAACKIAAAEGPDAETHATTLRDRLQARLTTTIPSLSINGDLNNHLRNNLHVSATGAPNDAVLARLQLRSLYRPALRAHPGTQEPSCVLRAIKLSPELQESALRISTGRFNTVDALQRSQLQLQKYMNDGARHKSRRRESGRDLRSESMFHNRIRGNADP